MGIKVHKKVKLQLFYLLISHLLVINDFFHYETFNKFHMFVQEKNTENINTR